MPSQPSGHILIRAGWEVNPWAAKGKITVYYVSKIDTDLLFVFVFYKQELSN